jgi:hypothetical protein
MEANKKFRLKRLTRLLTQIGYGCLIFFAVFLITTIILRSYSDVDWNKPINFIIIFIGLMGSLMASGILFIIAGGFQHQLLTYKRDIHVYRARNFAWNTIQYLESGELQLAIDEYVKCDWFPEKSLDDYLYGMLIMASYYSEDEKLNKVGAVRINNLKDRFNPDKIIFN